LHQILVITPNSAEAFLGVLPDAHRTQILCLLLLSALRLTMADIVLINPRFDISFWGLEYALPFIGKRAALPVAALPLLAALTPSGHRLTIIDENVEPIDFSRCARADIVGVTGMVVQRLRMREILSELKRRGAFTVVGGPWVSVSENYWRSRRRRLRGRGRGELASLSRRLGGGTDRSAIRAGRQDRHDARAGAAF
jgi:hypothetical protein